jgi:glucose-6-phosphate 1-dehydrogenase
MADGAQRVSLVMKRPDGPVRDVPGTGNVISLSIKGNGELDVHLVAKRPGPELAMSEATTRLDLGKVPGGTPLPPYASLLHDVLTGDRSLFTTSAGLAEAWRAVTPVLEDRPEVLPYAPGSWGPEAALDLAAPCGWLLGRQQGDGLPGGGLPGGEE